MTPSDRPRSYRDRDAALLAAQIRQPRRRPDLSLCIVCGKLHAFMGPDGNYHKCGFCCTRHEVKGLMRSAVKS